MKGITARHCEARSNLTPAENQNRTRMPDGNAENKD
jgi:hypothetical protein